MKIIQAQLENLDELTPLFDGYRVFYRKESDPEKAAFFLKQRLTIQDSVIYIAQDESGQALGFTQLFPSFSSTRMKRLWILNDLYVKKEHRGKGISKLLIEQAKELCKDTNACGLMLETEKSNDIGNQLYPSVGFHLETNNFYFWTAPTAL